jgi:hypothetical protein
MKVLDQSGKGMVAGSNVDLQGLGLPTLGRRATLLVFWKRL